jgi:hypothetical protein
MDNLSSIGRVLNTKLTQHELSVYRKAHFLDHLESTKATTDFFTAALLLIPK